MLANKTKIEHPTFCIKQGNSVLSLVSNVFKTEINAFFIPCTGEALVQIPSFHCVIAQISFKIAHS